MMFQALQFLCPRAVGQIPDAEGNRHYLGCGMRGVGIFCGEAFLFWYLLMFVWLIMSSSHLELPISRPINTLRASLRYIRTSISA